MSDSLISVAVLGLQDNFLLLLYLLVLEHCFTDDPSLSANRNGLRWQYWEKNVIKIRKSHSLCSTLRLYMRLKQNFCYQQAYTAGTFFCKTFLYLYKILSVGNEAAHFKLSKFKDFLKMFYLICTCKKWVNITFFLGAVSRWPLNHFRTSATCGVDSELDSGLSDVWILKSEAKRELWRIAAISPFTCTATSFCKAQKLILT